MKGFWPIIAIAAGALALIILINGCSPAAVMLPETYTPPPQEPASDMPLWLESPPPATICGLYLQDVRDLRAKDQRNLGGIGGVPVYRADMTKWVKSSFLTLDKQGYRVLDAVVNGPVPRYDVELKVDLIRAYIEGISFDKSATMVMRVNYSNADHGKPLVRIYRGVDTSVNLTGSASEIDVAFERATKKILDQIQEDLKGYCPV